MKYSIPVRKGIDDLKCVYAFVGNSQGDDYTTNNIDEYFSSGGWISVSDYFKDVDITDQKEINTRSKELELQNNQYIDELIKSGEYGKESSVEITVSPCKEFDKPSQPEASTESYRITWLQF